MAGAALKRNQEEVPLRATAPEPTHEQIRALAYTLWQKRGCPSGSPEVDWLKAERTLSQSAYTAPGIGATEEEVNMRGTVPQRIDSLGSKVEDIAGTGQQDAPGG